MAQYRHFACASTQQSNGNIKGGIAHLGHQFGTSSSAIKKVIQGEIARMGTNSALRASSPAIKRVMEGRIAHLGYQFGTSWLVLGNQKVGE
jgi:hypothetical protein